MWKTSVNTFTCPMSVSRGKLQRRTWGLENRRKTHSTRNTERQLTMSDVVLMVRQTYQKSSETKSVSTVNTVSTVNSLVFGDRRLTFWGSSTLVALQSLRCTSVNYPHDFIKSSPLQQYLDRLSTACTVLILIMPFVWDWSGGGPQKNLYEYQAITFHADNTAHFAARTP